jgi:hypothetical protein
MRRSAASRSANAASTCAAARLYALASASNSFPPATSIGRHVAQRPQGLMRDVAPEEPREERRDDRERRRHRGVVEHEPAQPIFVVIDEDVTVEERDATRVHAEQLAERPKRAILPGVGLTLRRGVRIDAILRPRIARDRTRARVGAPEDHDRARAARCDERLHATARRHGRGRLELSHAAIDREDRRQAETRALQPIEDVDGDGAELGVLRAIGGLEGRGLALHEVHRFLVRARVRRERDAAGGDDGGEQQHDGDEHVPGRQPAREVREHAIRFGGHIRHRGRFE